MTCCIISSSLSGPALSSRTVQVSQWLHLQSKPDNLHAQMLLYKCNRQTLYKAGMCVMVLYHMKNNQSGSVTLHIRLVCVFVTRRITRVVRNSQMIHAD